MAIYPTNATDEQKVFTDNLLKLIASCKGMSRSALEAEDLKIAELIRQNPEKICITTNTNVHGDSCIVPAIQKNLMHSVRSFIDIGFKVNKPNTGGNTPIFLAENQAMIEVLLKAGADIEARNKYLATPLWYHVVGYNKNRLLGLISYGANLYTQCYDTTSQRFALFNPSSTATLRPTMIDRIINETEDTIPELKEVVLAGIAYYTRYSIGEVIPNDKWDVYKIMAFTPRISNSMERFHRDTEINKILRNTDFKGNSETVSKIVDGLIEDAQIPAIMREHYVRIGIEHPNQAYLDNLESMKKRQSSNHHIVP